MYYYTYMTTHVNGKYYVGRHTTKNRNDNYFGSGKWIRSIKDKGDLSRKILNYFNSFEELLKATPQNSQYFQKTIDCYQQLQQFDVAEKAIKERLDKYKLGYLLVELGYNFQLQKNEASAKKYYEEAIERMRQPWSLMAKSD